MWVLQQVSLLWELDFLLEKIGMWVGELAAGMVVGVRAAGMIAVWEQHSAVADLVGNCG